MVAMTPLITIQIMGLIFRIKQHKLHKMVVPTVETVASSDDLEIIEL